MKLAVVTNEALKGEFFSRKLPDYANVCVVQDPRNIPPDTYIVFDLLFEHTPQRVDLLKQFLPRPVIINAVTDTLSEINQPFIRINAWPGFLSRDTIEVSASKEQAEIINKLFKELGWQYVLVPDITGMVSPRIIANIINEAYCTLAEKVSAKKEIDMAMKLGTNYPYGPFEWLEKIGKQNITVLYKRLRCENVLYEVSTLLTDEINV
ncbi:MAG: 3-hydroxyacyl-CoA dehydrogenase family protein [Chitinophagaceae bacterium]